MTRDVVTQVRLVRTGAIPDAGESGVGRRRELTSAQRRIWFGHSRRGDGRTDHQLCSVVRIDGPVQTARLRAAMSRVLSGHGVLTSTYHTDLAGEPYRLEGVVTPEWSHTDLTGLDAESVARRVEILRRRMSARPFDLSRESPVRTMVLRTGDTEQLLILSAHLIAWDDESLEILLDGLHAEYELVGSASAISDREPAPAAIDHEYWRGELSTAPPPIEFASPGVADETVGYAELTPDLVAQARRYAEARGVGLVAVLAAVHSALVFRCSGATDFVTAVPVSRRMSERADIGQCGNTILVRIQPAAQMSFDDHVAEVAAKVDASMRRRADGIEAVVDAVRPVRTRGADGLAQLTAVGFAVHEPLPRRQFGGLIVDVVEAGHARPPVPWHLDVELQTQRPRVRLTATDGSDDRTLAEAYAGYFVTALAAALRQPEVPLARLRLLSDADRERVSAVSRGACEVPADTTMPALLEAVARSAPDRTALRAERDDAVTTVSHGDLNARANRLARLLAARGVGAEDVVGLVLSGSVEFVVAVLAVLKAGAAYLPVDPANPPARRNRLLAAAAPVLVWQLDDVSAAESTAAQLDCADLSDADRVRPLHAANTAYVMYTSGSTGEPKGVPVSHAALTDHVVGFGKQWALPHDSRVLQTSAVSLDASVLDIFVTLSIGATIVLPEPAKLPVLTYLADLIDKHEITFLHLVPALLRELIALPHLADCRSLTHIAVGGDRLSGEITDRTLSGLDVELRNYYGPTEAVVSATHHRVRPASGSRIEPIGRPNRNVSAVVLDDQLELVPDGVLGELYLGGDQLARGYLNRPAMTSASYVADPFAAGARLYRTGDLVRRRRDGTLEFAGRRDDQVKIRGFRMELGEVVAAITGHPDVIDCHVVAKADPAGDTVLHAYLVGRPGRHLDPAAVRTFVGKHLPEVMVPVSYAVLGSLPRTTSGRVDTAALGPARPVAAGTRPPTSDAERDVAAVFARFFDVGTVHADDSFFDLGGHSLSAHRMLAALRAELGVSLGVSDLFVAPTVSGVAAAVEATRQRGARFAAPATARETLEPTPATAAQELAWRGGPDNVIHLRATMDGPLDRPALAAAVEQVTARHDATTIALDAEPGGAVHHVWAWDTADYVDRVGAPGPADDPDGFDPGERLWRFRLSGDPAAPTLTIAAHRAAADCWSVATVLREIAHSYAGESAGATGAARFVDYATWYQTCASTAGSAQNWWRSTYSGIPRRTAPVARASAGGPRTAAHFSVDPSSRRRLQAVAAKAGITERSLYEAAVAVVAQLLGAGPDVVLGTAAGRDTSPYTALVGPVNGPSVVRYDLAGELSLTSVLDLARLAVLGADTAPGVPVEVHRATALAEIPGIPVGTATVGFNANRPLTTVGFGAVRAVVDGPTPAAADGVVINCQARDGGIDVEVAAPTGQQPDAHDWCAWIDRTLTVLVEAPEMSVAELKTLGTHAAGQPRKPRKRRNSR